jgi:hypothetical protein
LSNARTASTPTSTLSLTPTPTPTPTQLELQNGSKEAHAAHMDAEISISAFWQMIAKQVQIWVVVVAQSLIYISHDPIVSWRQDFTEIRLLDRRSTDNTEG